MRPVADSQECNVVWKDFLFIWSKINSFVLFQPSFAVASTRQENKIEGGVERCRFEMLNRGLVVSRQLCVCVII